jgi:hypothetical protein
MVLIHHFSILITTTTTVTFTITYNYYFHLYFGATPSAYLLTPWHYSPDGHKLPLIRFHSLI